MAVEIVCAVIIQLQLVGHDVDVEGKLDARHGAKEVVIGIKLLSTRNLLQFLWLWKRDSS